MDLASISTAYEGLKIGKEILRTLFDLKVQAEAKDKIDQVMIRLGDAQDALFTMREELFRLQAENENLRKTVNENDKWDDRFQNYELVKTAGGAVVYRFKGEPEYYVCPSCVEKQLIKPLQDRRNYAAEHRCPGCNADYPIGLKERFNPPPTNTRKRSW